MILGETVTFTGLKACPFVGASLCKLCLPGGFAGSAESEASTDSGFPWSDSEASILAG